MVIVNQVVETGYSNKPFKPTIEESMEWKLFEEEQRKKKNTI